MQPTRLPNGDAELYLSVQTRAGIFSIDGIFIINAMGNTITETLLKAGKIYNKIVIISAGTLKISEDD